MKNNENPMVFALSTDTLSIEKFPVDDDGNIINQRFNAKTFTKKAYKSYLQGKSFFKYKGENYVVPKVRKDKLGELLDKIEIPVPEPIIEGPTEIDSIRGAQGEKAIVKRRAKRPPMGELSGLQG